MIEVVAGNDNRQGSAGAPSRLALRPVLTAVHRRDWSVCAIAALPESGRPRRGFECRDSGRISKEVPQPTDFEQGLAAVASVREWSDPRIATSIRDELIEALDGDDVAIEAMRPKLSASLSADLESVLGVSTPD